MKTRIELLNGVELEGELRCFNQCCATIRVKELDEQTLLRLYETETTVTDFYDEWSLCIPKKEIMIFQII
jgi:hypothetical protein